MLYVYLPIINTEQQHLDGGSIYRNSRVLDELNKHNIKYKSFNTIEEIQNTTFNKDDFLLSFNATLIANVKQLNTVDGVAMAKDKYISYVLASTNNIKMPITTLNPFYFKTFPIVMKERTGSLGINCFLIKNINQLYQLLKEVSKTKIEFIFQEFIPTSIRKSIRVLMINKKFVTAQLLENTNKNSFQSNAHQGGIGTIYNPSEEEIKMCEKIAQIFNLDYCGIDLLIGENNEKIFLEVNSSAQFKMLEETTKFNIAEKIIELVKEKINNN